MCRVFCFYSVQNEHITTTMQKLLFMLTALVCSSYLLAAKTYTFTLSVKSLATVSPLSGLLP